MMVHGISSEEVSMKMELADSELRMLVIEESASIIYKTNKVAVNLRNVQGTNGQHEMIDVVFNAVLFQVSLV